MRGILAGCCPRARLTLAVSSRAPPPTRAMNSRRFMWDMGIPPLHLAVYHEPGSVSLGQARIVLNRIAEKTPLKSLAKNARVSNRILRFDTSESVAVPQLVPRRPPWHGRWSVAAEQIGETVTNNRAPSRPRFHGRAICSTRLDYATFARSLP